MHSHKRKKEERETEREEEISIMYLDNNAHCCTCSSGLSRISCPVLPVRRPTLGKGLPMGKGHVEPGEVSGGLLVMLSVSRWAGF